VNGHLVKINDEHSHPSEKETIEVREFREKVKQRAVNETTRMLVLTYAIKHPSIKSEF
ncbi:unnamed protein product, partial [Rotaria socialis]